MNVYLSVLLFYANAPTIKNNIASIIIIIAPLTSVNKNNLLPQYLLVSNNGVQLHAPKRFPHIAPQSNEPTKNIIIPNIILIKSYSSYFSESFFARDFLYIHIAN